MQRSCADSGRKSWYTVFDKILKKAMKYSGLMKLYRKGIMRKPLIWYIP